MAFIDEINYFKALVDQRIRNKTEPLSIKKEDEANCFSDLADLLLQAFEGVSDEDKTIEFENTNSLDIDWQNETISELSDITYAQLFGNRPVFTPYQDNGDNTFTRLDGVGENRTQSSNGELLLSVQFILGAFPLSGMIIIN